MSTAAVFQIGSLGDSVLSLPALLSLRDLLPDCSEYFIVNRFDNAMKVIPAQVFDMAWPAKGRLGYRGRGNLWKQTSTITSLLLSLRRLRPRYAVSLMPGGREDRQVARDRAFFQAAGILKFVGFRALTPDEFGPKECPGVTYSEAYLRFRRLWGEDSEQKFQQYARLPLIGIGAHAGDTARKFLLRSRRFPERQLVALCPFSNCQSRDWSEQNIHQLLRKLEQTERVEVILLGGQKDKDAGHRAIRAAGAGINACGMFTLEQSAAVLTQCQMAIAVESGPMHLAAALDVPTVVVFSRITPHFYRWLPLGSRHTILYRDVACAGCRKLRCPFPNHPCMDDITSDHVFEVVMRRLQGHAVASVPGPGPRLLQLERRQNAARPWLRADA